MLKKIVAIGSMLFCMLFANVCEANHRHNTFEIHFIREYLDGERSIEVVNETATSVYDIIDTYQDWEFVEQSNHVVTLLKQVYDLSPLVKTNGYFIFDDMIPLFHQFHVDKLESRFILTN